MLRYDPIAEFPDRSMPSTSAQLMRSDRFDFGISIMNRDRQTHRAQTGEIVDVVTDVSGLSELDPASREDLAKGTQLIFQPGVTWNAKLLGASLNHRIDFG